MVVSMSLNVLSVLKLGAIAGLAASCSGSIDGGDQGAGTGFAVDPVKGQPTARPGTGKLPEGVPLAGKTDPVTGLPVKPVGPTDMPPAPGVIRPSPGGLRALTRTEMANTLRDLQLDNGSALTRLPEETLDLKGFAFDNNRKTNVKVGLNNVRALEALYQDLVAAAMADLKNRAALVPCLPSGPADASCMKQFVADFGLRALRRPLFADEAAVYESFIDIGKDANDFFAGAGAAMRAMLMSPEFVYRIEGGEPIAGSPGLVNLTGYEVATRMSFTLVGSTPDRMLLDDAKMGRLATVEGRRNAGTRLLATPAARARMNHFHAYWLGYQNVLTAGGANDPFLEESNALINDVVFENKRDYKDLLLSKKTFLGPALRKHYTDIGAPSTGTGWVNYPAADPARPGSERAGILSHGTFLSAHKDGEQTSVPRRGGLIYANLLCDPLPPPPPTAKVDLSGLQSTCVTGPKGFFAVTHNEPSCKACHNRLDPTGYGLERFSAAGKYRTADSGKPQCVIDTTGAKIETEKGAIAFDGPAALGRAIVDSGRFESCVARHAYRFMTGLSEEPEDEAAIGDLTQKFTTANRNFSGMWLDLVAAQSFAMARISDL